MKGIVIPQCWRGLLAKIRRQKGPSIILIIGAVDTGKSTLARFLFRELSKRETTALIDADLGQSSVGPPTTVGLARGRGLHTPLKAVRLRFVGGTSPVGFLLQTLVAVKRLVEEAASSGAARIVVDTSGLVWGVLGREFKFQKIVLLNPTHIIALQKEKELEPLLKNFSRRKGMRIYRVKVEERIVCPRSFNQRRLYREERFRRYFKKARLQSLSLEKVGLQGRVPDLRQKQNWSHLLIGLSDNAQNTLALGIVQNLDLARGVLSCITPLRKMEQVKTVQFGSLYLHKNGNELSRQKHPDYRKAGGG